MTPINGHLVGGWFAGAELLCLAKQKEHQRRQRLHDGSYPEPNLR
jgi:hypothetical protein